MCLVLIISKCVFSDTLVISCAHRKRCHYNSASWAGNTISSIQYCHVVSNSKSHSLLTWRLVALVYETTQWWKSGRPITDWMWHMTGHFSIFSAGAPSRMAGWRLDFNSFYISSELLRTRIIPAQQMLSRLFWRSTTSVLPLSPNLCENKMACDSSASLIASVYNVGKLYHWMSGLQNAAVQLLTTDGF